jgi:hypothetical protein
MSIDDTDDVGFLRLRRNIIFLSLTILFFELVGLKVTELSLLGNKVSIENPLVIELSLVVFYSYCLIRYHQIYKSDRRDIILDLAKVAYKNNNYTIVDSLGNYSEKQIIGWKAKINYVIRSSLHYIFREPAYSNIEFPLHLAITSGLIVIVVKLTKFA